MDPKQCRVITELRNRKLLVARVKRELNYTNVTGKLRVFNILFQRKHFIRGNLIVNSGDATLVTGGFCTTIRYYFTVVAVNVLMN